MKGIYKPFTGAGPVLALNDHEKLEQERMERDRMLSDLKWKVIDPLI